MRVLFLALLSIIFCADAAQAAMLLDRPTRDAVEGRWVVVDKPVARPCNLSDENSASVEAYQIEFSRSGGSFRIADDVDADWRGVISDARMTGNAIALTLTDTDGTPFKGIRFVRIGKDRMRWKEVFARTSTLLPSAGFAYRCGKPRRGVTAGLDADALQFVSGMPAGNVYFVPSHGGDDAGLCKTGYAAATRFDLIGPVFFFAERYDAADDWFTVRKATGDAGRVTLSLQSRSAERSSIDIVRRDAAHAEIPAWGGRYRRCTG